MLVEIEEPKLSSSAFYVYIIPMVFMIIGVLVGLWVGENSGFEDLAEFISVGTGILFLVIGYILLSLFDRRRRKNPQTESVVQMKQIIENKEDPNEKND